MSSSARSPSMACARVSAKITGSLSTIRCAARAAAAVSAVRLGSPLAITRARVQSITSIIAQNNLYNNGHTITLKRQCARLTNSTVQSLPARSPFPRADRAFPPIPDASRSPCPDATAGSPTSIFPPAPADHIGAHTTAPMDHRAGCLPARTVTHAPAPRLSRTSRPTTLTPSTQGPSRPPGAQPGGRPAGPPSPARITVPLINTGR